MEIVFAIKSINNRGGGAEHVLAKVTGGLAERDHRIVIITYDPPDATSFYPLHPSVKRVNLNIGDPESRTTLWETLQRMIALRRTIVQIDPDIVVGFMVSMFIPLGLALTGTKFPVIASEHIGVEYYRYRLLENFLLQFIPYITKKITVISEQLRNGFNAHLRRYMTVIPNPVSMPAKILTDRVKPNPARKTILSVGRLTPQKDHKTLIEAYATLVDDFPEWDLRIVGDGELHPQLEAQIKTLGLQERIKLTGITTNIEEEYLGAQLFVMPSRYESFGLATAEALTYGLPAVGFADCPGTNELIIHDQNGILIQGLQRASVLADGLGRLMNSPELRERLGNEGPDSMAGFSIEKICDHWEKLLSKYEIGSK